MQWRRPDRRRRRPIRQSVSGGLSKPSSAVEAADIDSIIWVPVMIMPGTPDRRASRVTVTLLFSVGRAKRDDARIDGLPRLHTGLVSGPVDGIAIAADGGQDRAEGGALKDRQVRNRSRDSPG